MTAVEMREKQLNIRLSDEEATRLDAIAAHHGLNAAAVIRMLLKKEERAIAAEAPSIFGAGQDMIRKGVREVFKPMSERVAAAAKSEKAKKTKR